MKNALKKHSIAITIITMLMRLCVGIVFVYSGLVKGIDPWGTIYKMEEYLAAMDITFPGTMLVGAVFGLIAVEFVTGVFLVFGCCRRLSVWIAAAMMAVMTPLTAWVMISDPVPDCGCFGDALVLSNSATFLKNVALCVAILWLLIFNRKVRAYITPSLQWIELVASGVFILAVSLYGYAYQPLIDFRPYKVGEAIVAADIEDEQEAEYAFVYSKDGKEQQFDIDNIPDESEGWTFVRRQLIKAAEAPADGRLIAVSNEDGEDVTAELLQTDQPTMLLLYPTLNDFNIAATYKINALHDYCLRKGITMLAIVAAGPEQLAYFRDVAMPSYPIYTAEDTSIKEVARGLPAIVYMQDGVIKWKQQLRDIEVTALEADTEPLLLYTDYSPMLPWLGLIFTLFSMLLVALSLYAIRIKKVFKTPSISNFLDKLKKESKKPDEEEESEELNETDKEDSK